MRRLQGFHLHGLMSFLEGALQQLFYEQRALHRRRLHHHYVPQLQLLSSSRQQYGNRIIACKMDY